ncbi:MAG: hypothetical protein ACRDYU_04465, partial [Actinomycetes bacterium]
MAGGSAATYAAGGGGAYASGSGGTLTDGATADGVLSGGAVPHGHGSSQHAIQALAGDESASADTVGGAGLGTA